MDRRSNNIAIFQDSMDLIKANQKLQQAVQFSIQNQKLYVPSQAIAPPEPGKSPCKTIVSSKRSFESASAYAKAGKRVCVLNFASATNPGGGVTLGGKYHLYSKRKQQFLDRHISQQYDQRHA